VSEKTKSTKPKLEAVPDAEPSAVIARLRSKRPAEQAVKVFLDDSLVERVRELELEHAAAVAREDEDEAAAVEATLEDARDELAAETIDLLFRSIGSEAYDALVLEHPATDRQNADHMKQYGIPAPYNSDTFPPAVIAASLAEMDGEPQEVTAAEVSTLFETWNGSEVVMLFEAALLVNTSRRTSLGNS
jgi:hypothetical protein